MSSNFPNAHRAERAKAMPLGMAQLQVTVRVSPPGKKGGTKDYTVKLGRNGEKSIFVFLDPRDGKGRRQLMLNRQGETPLENGYTARVLSAPPPDVVA